MNLPPPYYEEPGITLYHADARDILPALAPQGIDLIWTDPPFGHRNNDDDLIARREAALGRQDLLPHRVARPIANDGVEANGLVRWMFTEAARLLKAGCCCCCCCCGGGPDPQFARWSLWMDEVLQFKQMVVWDKGPMGMGWHYRRSYETVLVAHTPGRCRWYDTTSKVENILRTIPKLIPAAEDHPTPKPEALVAFFVRLHSQPGDLVLDPFLGAGTAARVCKDTGRRFIGVEIEERWCEMAVERLAQQTFAFG